MLNWTLDMFETTQSYSR